VSLGRPKRPTLLIAALAITALATAGYWTAFFTAGSVQVRGDPTYLAFERAFPLADAWMAACAAAGALGLARDRPWGFLFGLLAAGSLVYLGCLDVLFNINAGNYAIAGGAMAVETVINGWSIVAGAWLIHALWRRRDALIKPGV